MKSNKLSPTTRSPNILPELIFQQMASAETLYDYQSKENIKLTYKRHLENQKNLTISNADLLQDDLKIHVQ